MQKTWIVCVCSLLLARVVCAQESGASVSGTVAAMNMSSRTNIALAGGFAYKFNRVAGFELETTWVPNLRSDAFSRLPVILIYPTPRYENEKGRAVLVTNNVRIDIPTTMTRLVPYFVAGAGIAHTRATADYTLGGLPIAASSSPVVSLTPTPITRGTIATSLYSQPVSSSSVDLAMTLGGGLSIGLGSRLSLDVDLRMFRLLGDSDRNAGRFGVGTRYRFGR